MGLSIEVGILADLKEVDEDGFVTYRQQFARINRYLRVHALPEHQEPENIEPKSWDLGGYWPLHSLRRMAAWIHLEGRLPPNFGTRNSNNDPILDRYYDVEARQVPETSKPYFDHLVFHSDTEGFYLPRHFFEIMFPDEELGIDGEMIGSAKRLLEECTILAKVLQIPVDIDLAHLPLEKPESQVETSLWKYFATEAHVCTVLQRAARFSLEKGAAIVFC